MEQQDILACRRCHFAARSHSVSGNIPKFYSILHVLIRGFLVNLSTFLYLLQFLFFLDEPLCQPHPDLGIILSCMAAALFTG